VNSISKAVSKPYQMVIDCVENFFDFHIFPVSTCYIKPVKSVFLNAHKPGFASLKTNVNPGFRVLGFHLLITSLLDSVIATAMERRRGGELHALKIAISVQIDSLTIWRNSYVTLCRVSMMSCVNHCITGHPVPLNELLYYRADNF